MLSHRWNMWNSAVWLSAIALPMEYSAEPCFDCNLLLFLNTSCRIETMTSKGKDDESCLDAKPAAVSRHDKSQKVSWEDKNSDAIAREAFDGCQLQIEKSRRTIQKNGVKLRECEHISTYTEELKAIVPLNIATIESLVEIANSVTNLIMSSSARLAVLQMVNIFISIVDIFCSTRVDLFSRKSGQLFPTEHGPYKSMQFVISKFCRYHVIEQKFVLCIGFFLTMLGFFFERVY